jgi:hypothetical protein
MKILESKIKNILREFDYKLEEYCYNDKRKYVVVQAIGKYDRDILWFMPRDEYDFDIKADQQMFTYWTSLNYTTLVDIYQSIRAEGFYWLNLVRKELYKKVK